MHHMQNNKFTPTSSAGGFLTPLSQVMSLVSYLQSVERLRKYLKAQAFKFLLGQMKSGFHWPQIEIQPTTGAIVE
jgi:hypothetical protein